jgi:hypothetical protein
LHTQGPAFRLPGYVPDFGMAAPRLAKAPSTI